MLRQLTICVALLGLTLQPLARGKTPDPGIPKEPRELVIPIDIDPHEVAGRLQRRIAKEEQKHLRRLAFLDEIHKELAALGKDEAKARAEAALKKETKRHEQFLIQLGATVIAAPAGPLGPLPGPTAVD